MIAELAYVVMIGGGLMLVLGLATAVVDRPPGRAQLIFAAVVELLVLVQSAIALVRIGIGFRPAETATTIGYLIGILVLIPIAWFWANNERTRFSGVVLAVAGVSVAVMSLRLLSLWVSA